MEPSTIVLYSSLPFCALVHSLHRRLVGIDNAKTNEAPKDRGGPKMDFEPGPREVGGSHFRPPGTSSKGENVPLSLVRIMFNRRPPWGPPANLPFRG